MKTASCFAAGLAALSLALPPVATVAAVKSADPPAAPAGPGSSSLLTNADKAAITSIYVAQTGTENWTDDLLGKQTAGAGKTVSLRISGPPEQCRYDLQVLMNDGKSVQMSDLNIRDAPTLPVLALDGPGAYRSWRPGR